MRLALLCNDYWPTIGGVQTAVRGLAQGLKQRGHQPMVLTRQPGGCAAAEEVDGIPVRRFEWNLRPRLTFPFRAWRARNAVRRAVLDWGAEAFYVHFVSVHALYAWDCARIARVPLLLSFRGNDVMQIGPRSPVTRRIYARLTAAANVNLFCSPWLERQGQAARWFRGRSGTMGVLADAVVVEPREAPEVPASTQYAFAAGRMVRKKGFDLLLRAWAGLDADVGLPLWIAGDGEERVPLERLAAELRLGSRVRFLGPVAHQEVLGLVERAALTIVPSREEPYGIVVVEAQALGVPVIATRVGNLPKLIAHGTTGYLAEPTVEGLASAIREAWADSRRVEVGQAGRVAAGAQRGYDTMAAELEEWVEVARFDMARGG